MQDKGHQQTAPKKPRVPKFEQINKETERGEFIKRNKTVTQKIARIDKDVLKTYKKNPAGRKRKYTPTKMKNSINAYFDWCETEDRVPSISGLMIYLKMYRDQFYTYMTYPEFTDIMEHARLIIKEWCENDVYQTKGQAAAKIAYMKNLHDWTEKTESNTTVTKIVSVEEAKARIEMLAPKLLEVLKNNTVLSQLVLENKEENPKEIVLNENEYKDSSKEPETNLRRL